MQDVGRLLVLGAELTQMPAWYVDLSYAQALESYALLAHQPADSKLQLFRQGMCYTWLHPVVTSGPCSCVSRHAGSTGLLVMHASCNP